MQTREDEPASADRSDGEAHDGTPQVDVEKAKVRELARARLFGASAAVSRIGRHTILGRLGRGGMGVVFSAYDPELDRKIAIKLIRAGSGSPEARERLQREAQSLAKLSHPNVIHVYDVGTHEGEVYIAMEYVDGETLEAWMQRSSSRPWREVVDLFVQAGRGLASAHASGVIHRDFKPANVMVDKSGRARVLDFGLARSSVAGDVTLESGSDPARSTGPNTDRLTRTGAALGTPAYMAPEQWLDQTIDARTDQFGFCVALYEGLYGHAPFAAKTAPELADAVTHGRVREPSSDRGVPGWLRSVVMRGLDSAPGQRFPSMDDLLRELARDPGARRRRIALAAGGLATVAGVAWATHSLSSRRCSGSEAAVADAWSSERAAATRGAFSRTGVSYADDSAGLALRALDDYTAQWVSGHRDACEATQIRGEQSQTLMDLRIGCLRRRKSELRALVDLFERADPDIVEHSARAVSDLTPVSVCSDAELLQAPVPLPDDPGLRAAVEATREQLAEVQALDHAGKYAEGLERARVLAETAAQLEYAPLTGEVMHRLGLLLGGVGDAPAGESALRAAIAAASEGKNDRVTAEAWIRLLYNIGHRQSRHDDAMLLVPAAEAAVARAGGPPGLQAFLHNSLGSIRNGLADYARSLAHYEESLRLYVEAFGREHSHVASVLSNASGVLLKLGRFESAMARDREALAIRERVFGARHPAVANALINLGAVHVEEGRTAEALVYYERALSIFERSLGTAHPRLCAPLNNIAEVLRLERRHEDALAYFQRALEVAEGASVAQPRLVASLLSNVGTVLSDLEQFEAAADHHRRSVALFERVFGPDHPDTARALVQLGSVAVRAGNLEAALPSYVRALSIFESKLGKDHRYTAATVGNLAHVEARLGDESGAEDRFRRALGIFEQVYGQNNAEVAEALQNLASHLHTVGTRRHDRERLVEALSYYRRSANAFERAPGPNEPYAASAWAHAARVMLELGYAEPALGPAEDALAILESIGSDDAELANARLTLARVRWATGGDRASALDLAAKSRQTYERLNRSDQLQRIDAWLRGKGAR